MPFLNDVIESNKEQLDKAQAASSSSPVSTTSRFIFDPDRVFGHLSERIVGQPQALDALHDMLHVVKADFALPARPLSVMLFVGSTGVGKTEAVRVLTESILGSQDELCRIDMNTLAQEHYSAALLGAPPGYVGSKENNTLLNPEKIEGSFSRPGVVLFDELEKADDAVIRALLNVIDHGHLSLSTGTKSIDFKNAMIFMTSNIGVRELASYRKRYTSGWRKWMGLKPSKSEEHAILQSALEGRLDPEFVNRIDRIVYFNELDKEWLDRLLYLELANLNQRLSKKGRSLELATSAEEFLSEFHDARYGARALKRRVRKALEPALARAMNQYPEETHFVARREGDQLRIEPHANSV